ncbi:hypothetical protein V6B16_10220 [Salinimicrobium catena]|uniref:hypothetical protein n=1 Tax=Salinimicrobium catena TaxID=390640 RepID=UPI002FE47893
MKKLTLTTLMGIWVFFTACSPNENDGFQDNTLDLKASKIEATVLNIPNLFPEGLEYDHWNDRFIISVALAGTIGIVENGEFSTLINDNTLVVPIGTHIDKARKRLLVANADHGFGAKSGIPLSIGGLASYDLSGNLIFYSDFTNLDLGMYFPNDVTVDNKGNAYVTDSFNGVIYKVDRDGDPEIFYYSPELATMPNNVGLNGIEYDARGFLLVAHSFTNRLLKFPIDDPAAYTEVDLSDPLYAPDGIYLRSPNELLIANNGWGTEAGQVQVLTTTDMWETSNLEEVFFHPNTFPSSVTIKRGTPYVLHSYIHYFFAGMDREIFEIVPLE